MDVARDRQVVIESLLFVRLRINNRIVKRECRLLGDRFEDDKIVLREGGTHSAVGKSEHAHVLFRVEKRRHHHGSRAERTVSQRRQFRCFGKFIQTKRRGRLPYAPKHSLAVSDIVNPKKIFQRDRCPRRLLQNMRRNVHQRRTTLRNESRHKFGPGSISQIKRATLCVEDAGRSFDNQSVQIRRPDCFAESLAQPVQEIENQGLLDLNFFLRMFQPANASALSHQRINPRSQTHDQQPEENGWPHEVVASLLPRCRLMEVLF